MKAAIIGGGVIGGGWAARFLLNGWDVAVHDPAPDAAAKINAVLENARASLPALYDVALPVEGQLTFAPDIQTAIQGALWIQESVPENIDLKRRVYKEIEQSADVGAIVGSSTSGFCPSDLQQGVRRPGQLIVAHPFNPVYLLPLVELVPSAATAPEVTQRATEILTSLGMHPLLVRAEIDAHIADRLLEAVWREALWLVHDGIATTAEIDDAIRYGFGLRWGQMGLFETYRIAGGAAGMRHFMQQFGPALAWPWSKLTDVPEFTPDLVDLIASQSDAQSGHLTFQELERQRDGNLVAMIRALKQGGTAAGGTVAQHEKTLTRKQVTDSPQTVDRSVPPTWTDYNGHMNETHYLEVAAQATDRFMEMVGVDAAYIAAGRSFFTVETHIRHLDEVTAGDRIRVTTQVIAGKGKKMHLFHRLLAGADRRLVATVETLVIHVDLTTRRSTPPPPEIASALAQYAADHAALALPDGAGRAVGQKT
ncbi:carnitine 3-dehydrogenase [Marinovum sp. 2_MG-2023]|uniref:carnitine 3-dehydrogenase n=1 Tax=unclassified Marinovum TaxID=2647166 RepID=UPI0026E481B6|nr:MULTISPECIES: carnitine 3-dehydrogenase [unclassified Marinovum]MDO6730459.1 carnitine 3-dehydrogenase [Marinovum sp. 2_MG-2023]MDO6778439.1 carnitine 3-dehydrogenase [Marinovum sp. 1_MG-2023]